MSEIYAMLESPTSIVVMGRAEIDGDEDFSGDLMLTVTPGGTLGSLTFEQLRAYAESGDPVPPELVLTDESED